MKSAIKKVVTMENIANVMKSEFYRSLDIMRVISEITFQNLYVYETNLDVVNIMTE